MKKNVMMRIASFLLIAVLVSTSAISGTYAKYVTTAEGKEAARVAKWGVQVGVEGFSDADDDGLFLTSYAKDSSTAIATTVEAEDKVVAPGTKNAEGITFTLTGTPEVAVKIEVKVTSKGGMNDKAVDVVLPAGEDYTDWTVSVDGQYSETFDNAEDYHPVKFTLYDKGNMGSPIVKAGTLAEVEKALEDLSGEYAPGTNLNTLLANNYSGVYVLTWAWDFDDNGAGTYDKQDTLLGNIAAELDTVDGASVALDFEVSITATQID